MDKPQITIQRPHASADVLVTEDAWIVGRSDILLLGADELPPKTLVAFEIRIASGDTVIQGEGWATDHEQDNGAGTAGLRVKLRTLDRPSKALLRRMLERQKKGLANKPEPPPPGEIEEDEEIPISVEELEPISEVDAAPAEGLEAEAAAAVGGVEIEEVTVEELGGSWFPPGQSPEEDDEEDDEEDSLSDRAAATDADDEVPPPLDAAEPDTTADPSDADASPMVGEALTGEALTGEALTGEALTGEALTGEALTGAERRGEQSGVRHRPAAPVQPPENREELLERLRARARGIAKAKIADIASSDEAAS